MKLWLVAAIFLYPVLASANTKSILPTRMALGGRNGINIGTTGIGRGAISGKAKSRIIVDPETLNHSTR